MVKYNQKRKSGHTGNGLLRSLMLVAASFFSGYIVASFVDIGKVGAWVGSLVPEKSRLEPVPQFAHQHTDLKPKLEFYTLLTANHGPAVASVPASALSSVSPQNVAVKSIPDTHPLQVKPVAPNGNVAVAKVSKPVETVSLAKGAAQKIDIAKSNYSIQVAAMRTLQDAERVKASLLLKGFEVNISTVASNGALWYRVMVGRFSSREQAVKTQVVLAHRDRMNGMIRKLDA